MSSENLVRLSGLAAILAGLLRGVNSLAPSSTPSVTLELLYLLTDIFILFGIMGIYGFQYKESGLWGFLGFLFATIGTGMIIGPDGEVSGINMYPVGASILALGLTCLAIGSWIASKFPRWVPMFWVISSILGFIGYFIPNFRLLFVASGVIFGIGFAGAGIKIWSATMS